MRSYFRFGFLVILFLFIIILGFFAATSAILLSFVISIALISAAIVPLTFTFGLITGQSYDRVCDNSEVIYKLNQFGKWVWAFILGLFITYFIYKVIQ